MRFKIVRGDWSVLITKVMRIAFKIISRINRIAGLFGMWMLFIMALLVVADIISRELANKSLPGVTEIVYLGVVAVVFLSFAYTEEMRAHVRIEIFSDRLPPKGRTIVDILTWLVGASLMGLLAWLAGLEAIESLEVREYIPSAIRVPIYPVKFAVCIGFGLLGLQFLVNLVKKLMGETFEGERLSTGEEADERNL
ncbi:MAG: TRAP transporter small permease [Dehalococcoidia bacterium]